MITLSEAIANMGIVENKAIKAYETKRKNELKRVKRNFPKGLDHDQGRYINAFMRANHLIVDSDTQLDNPY